MLILIKNKTLHHKQILKSMVSFKKMDKPGTQHNKRLIIGLVLEQYCSYQTMQLI